MASARLRRQPGRPSSRYRCPRAHTAAARFTGFARRVPARRCYRCGRQGARPKLITTRSSPCPPRCERKRADDGADRAHAWCQSLNALYQHLELTNHAPPLNDAAGVTLGGSAECVALLLDDEQVEACRSPPSRASRSTRTPSTRPHSGTGTTASARDPTRALSPQPPDLTRLSFGDQTPDSVLAKSKALIERHLNVASTLKACQLRSSLGSAPSVHWRASAPPELSTVTVSAPSFFERVVTSL